MNIRTKILLSVAVGAAFAALAAVEIVVSGAKPVAVVAAVAAAFLAMAAVVGLFVADSVAEPLDKAARYLAKISASASRNANDSNWAKLLAVESNAAVSEGNAAAKRLAEAVDLIKISSENNAKIVKAVNYMALRANFLYFNASVVSARAGETGKEFAYVADEMRSFAIRCARAAQNTADMIEESKTDIESVARAAGEVANAVRTMADRADNVNGLIAEIAKASDEQVRDVERVKESVARMKPDERPAAGFAAAGVAEKSDAPTPEPVNASDGSADGADRASPDADQRGRRGMPVRQKRYAAFPGQRAFSAALALWAPMRAADAEEAVAIGEGGLPR